MGKSLFVLSSALCVEFLVTGFLSCSSLEITDHDSVLVETVSGSSQFLLYVELPVHSPYLLKSDGSALSLGPQFYIRNGWRCAQDHQLASLQWHLNPSPWLCPQISTGKCWCICNSSFVCTQPTVSIHCSLLVQSFSQFLLHWLGFRGGSLGKNPPAKQET